MVPTHPVFRAGYGVPSLAGSCRAKVGAKGDKQARFTALLHHRGLGWGGHGPAATPLVPTSPVGPSFALKRSLMFNLQLRTTSHEHVLSASGKRCVKTDHGTQAQLVEASGIRQGSLSRYETANAAARPDDRGSAG